MIKISVLLSVFNTAKYLEKCLDSICQQTLKEVEIICINDGSTDDSLGILRKYAQKDSRIKVINQKNQGAAISRNNGIKIASGKYLSILDSDDFFDIKMLEKMFEKAEKTHAEIVMCGCNYFDESTLKYEKAPWSLVVDSISNKKTFSKENVPETLFQITIPNAFTKIFKREFILENNLQFQDLPSCNDLAFTYSAILLANKISAINEPLVNYRKDNPNSISEKRGQTSQCVVDAYQEVLRRCDINENLIGSFYKRVLNSFNFEYNLCHPNKKADLFNSYRNFLPENFWREFLTTYKIRYQSKLNQNDIKVSVIIPVYNVEKYLNKCISSVVGQTFKDLEIICINDGSSDSSSDLLLEYAQKDPRIVVINQKNAGLSAARNLGLKEAKAKYILFIDSDDYILPEAIEKLYDAMVHNDVGLTLCALESFVEDEKFQEHCKQIQDYYNKTTPTKGVHKILSFKDFRSSACAKLFKKSVIDKYDMKFPEGLINEDEAWQWYYLSRINSYYSIDEKLYMRLIRDGSIMSERDFNYKNPTDFIYVLKNIYEYLNKNNLFYVHREEFQKFFNLQCKTVLSKYPPKIRKEGIKLAKKVAKDCSVILNYAEPRISQEIFSIKKDSRHYILKILGIKIKLGYNELL